MINNKKAILLKNAMGLIIAVLGLALLLTGAYTIYKRATHNQAMEDVQNLINTIEAKINIVQNNQNITFLIREIQDKESEWFLTSWNAKNPNAPGKCFYKSCLCICPGKTAEDCDTRKGFCRQFKEIQTINTFHKYIKEIEKITPITGGQTSTQTYKTKQTDTFIKLNGKNLFEMQISKTKDTLTLTKNTENEE